MREKAHKRQNEERVNKRQRERERGKRGTMEGEPISQGTLLLRSLVERDSYRPFGLFILYFLKIFFIYAPAQHVHP